MRPRRDAHHQRQMPKEASLNRELVSESELYVTIRERTYSTGSLCSHSHDRHGKRKESSRNKVHWLKRITLHSLKNSSGNMSKDKKVDNEGVFVTIDFAEVDGSFRPR